MKTWRPPQYGHKREVQRVPDAGVLTESPEGIRIRIEWECEELRRLIFGMPTFNAKTVFVVNKHLLA